jgi:NADH:ubiquinone oxidoreductase subunit F (NADH-binding)/(2Fe-2S) ferredoxin
MESDNSILSITNLIERIRGEEKVEIKGGIDNYLAQLRRHKLNRTAVFIGVTTSSIAAGALETKDAAEAYISDRELDVEVVEVGSNGLCSFEPIMEVQVPGKSRVAFRNVKANDVSFILDGILNNHLPIESVIGQHRYSLHQPWGGIPFLDEISFFKGQQREILELAGVICPTSIEEYIAFGGYEAFTKAIRKLTLEDVCRTIEESGLRGRGGGGYCTGLKWKMALAETASQKYFVCNADESDPGAFMHRLMMESNPHLIVEGIAIASYAIGASKAYLYTRNRYTLTVQRLENAIQQAYKVGLLGHNILDSGFSLDIILRKGPGAYVCGEETALISSLEGKRGMPTLKPPFPTQKGLFGKPTVVNNVETVANIPIILRKGADRFSSIGTEKSKGTKLFSVSGKVNITCLVEVPLGTSISTLIELAQGVPVGRKLKAVQMGGPSGGCTVPEKMNTPIDFETLKAEGLAMGSGGITVLDDSVCMIDTVKYFMNFIQRESCGKCIPCREGSRRMLEILDSITRRPITDEGHNTLERFKGVILLESLAEVMRDTSLCGLGQTAPNPVLSTLKAFREEFEEHIFDRKCTASVCRNLRTFYIDIDKCTGCSACAKKCPTNAIIGAPRSPYFVVEEKCIGCGICETTCKFGAVFFK